MPTTTALRKPFILILAAAVLMLGCTAAQADHHGNKADKKIKVGILTGQNNHGWMMDTPVLKNILDDAELFDTVVARCFELPGLDFLSDQGVTLEDFRKTPTSEKAPRCPPDLGADLGLTRPVEDAAVTTRDGVSCPNGLKRTSENPTKILAGKKVEDVSQTSSRALATRRIH